MSKKKRKIDLLFVTACISTSMVLSLIGVVSMLFLAMESMSKEIKEEMRVEIVLSPALSGEETELLRKSIDGRPYCKDIRYISKEEALEVMSQAMGCDPTEFLEYNPFYASFNMGLHATYACGDSINGVERELLPLDGVQEINYQRDLIESINSNISKISIILLAFALLLSLISYSLINNTIKLTVYAQRFVLYSMKLVGAKWSFIRRPFIRRNLWVGVVSALIACATIWSGMDVAAEYEPVLALFATKEILLPSFAVMAAAGILITALCALVSVNKFLKMKSGELYYI